MLESCNFTNLVVEQKGNLGIITLNRPRRLNALSKETLEELAGVLASWDTEPDIRAILITGSGEKAFSVGADIRQFASASEEENMAYFSLAGEVFGQIERMSKIVIAAINGYALGGGLELALACDLRVASEKAVFGLPEVKIGVMPCWGGTQRLPRIVGWGRAKTLACTGETISSDQALQWGLVSYLFPQMNFMEQVLELAGRMVENSPTSLKYIKETFCQTLDMKLHDGLVFEREQVRNCLRSEDYHEGIRAFLEKRTPSFPGR